MNWCCTTKKTYQIKLPFSSHEGNNETIFTILLDPLNNRKNDTGKSYREKVRVDRWVYKTCDFDTRVQIFCKCQWSFLHWLLASSTNFGGFRDTVSLSLSLKYCSSWKWLTCVEAGIETIEEKSVGLPNFTSNFYFACNSQYPLGAVKMNLMYFESTFLPSFNVNHFEYNNGRKVIYGKDVYCTLEQTSHVTISVLIVS